MATEDTERRNNYFRSLLCSHKILNDEETLELVAQAQSDLADKIKDLEKRVKWGGEKFGYSAAMNEIMLHYQRLIFRIAKKIYNNLPEEMRTLVEFFDLTQAGNFGLYRAVLKFDCHRKRSFVVFACKGIYKSIKEMLDAECFRVFRIKVHIFYFWNLYDELLKKAGCAGVDLDQPLPLFDGMSMREIEDAINMEETICLDEEIGDDPDERNLTYGEIIPDRSIIPSDEKVIRNESGNVLEKIFRTANLKERHEEIIASRFGIGGREAETLESLGRCYEVTYERVRQIEKVSLKKLRRACAIVSGQELKAAKQGEGEKTPVVKHGLELVAIFDRLQLIKEMSKGKGKNKSEFLEILEVPSDKAEIIIRKRRKERKEAAKRCKKRKKS